MLGSNLLASASRNSKIQVTGWTRKNVDLTDQIRVFEEFESLKPTTVIHAAAKVGGIHANIANPAEFLNENIVLDSNVIMGAFKSGVKNLVYVGSSCMYPKDFRQPLNESDILAAPLEPTNEGYAIAKIAGSKLCEYLSREYGVNYRTIVPSNLYGPEDNFNSKSSHLVAACILKVHEAMRDRREFIDVWGDGSARREFTYTRDLAEWLLENLGRLDTWPPLVNLGSGKDYSVNDYYELAMAAVGYRVELVHDLNKPSGMKQKLMDSSFARENLAWDPKTSIEDGMAFTYSAFTARKMEPVNE